MDPVHRRCDRHRAQERKKIDRERGSAARQGFGVRRRAARKRILEIAPPCAECNRRGWPTDVDNIVSHKGDAVLFLGTKRTGGHGDIKELSIEECQPANLKPAVPGWQ